MAQVWADQCKFQHDCIDCRKLSKSSRILQLGTVTLILVGDILKLNSKAHNFVKVDTIRIILSHTLGTIYLKISSSS